MSFGSSGRFQRRRDSENIDYGGGEAGRGYESGTGAEYMARSGWGNNGAFTRNAFTTDEHQITFHKDSSKTALLIALIVVGTLLILFIVAIVILFTLKVLVLNPQDKTHSTSSPLPTTYRPLSTLPQHGSTIVSVTLIPPEVNRPSAIPSETIAPPVEQFVKRNFVCNMYILQQANPAYDDRSHYEYTQATQMILNALKAMLKQSTLGSYLENVSIRYLENSGSNLLVQFEVDLLVPPNSGINATVLRNVIISDLLQVEQQLNAVEIDRETLSVITV
uniref:SEA domain-containing protein n=1 Tax=Parascaris univalens TaxID=6257 RepID=A0A915B668_PARUN